MPKRELEQRFKKAIEEGVSVADLSLGTKLLEAMSETVHSASDVGDADDVATHAMIVGLELGLCIANQDREAGKALYKVFNIMSGVDSSDVLLETTVPAYLESRKRLLEMERAGTRPKMG